ncbi:hypothetical protein FRC11_001672 [Ceratobasidium sp. 423]|nr:hypothetical protein FRC11_001672 [Ceratobasidium sp. 423]
MGWYEQQTESSTKFTLIEHRKELKAPFYHEYLLIHLDDGAICRLERMGEGSRKDAIRRVGCTAHDIIQWFPKSKYCNDPLSKEPSELVVRIEFPREFDLLDILAICFSVQNVEISSAYTLQRYNCYFLCSTVLGILARRTAAWEAAITQDNWGGIVDNALHKLQTMEYTDVYEYLGFGICSLVNPDTPEPCKFILYSLSVFLRTTSIRNLNQDLSDTLWYRDLEPKAHAGLSSDISRAAERALRGTEPCATRMKQLLRNEMDLEPRAVIMKPEFQQTVAYSYVHGMRKAWRTSAQTAASTYAMQRLEDPTPFGRRVFSRFFGGIKGASDFLRGGRGWDDFDGCGLMTRAQLAVLMFPVFVEQAKLKSIQNLSEANPEYEELYSFNDISLEHAGNTVLYDILQSALCGGRDESLAVLSEYLDNDDWALCLGICMARQIKQEICSRSSLKGLIQVHTPSDPARSRMTVNEFQEYTLKRIQDHAQRVASVGLAAAPLVQSDIECAMGEVWKSLPHRLDDLESRN